MFAALILNYVDEVIIKTTKDGAKTVDAFDEFLNIHLPLNEVIKVSVVDSFI